MHDAFLGEGLHRFSLVLCALLQVLSQLEVICSLMVPFSRCCRVKHTKALTLVPVTRFLPTTSLVQAAVSFWPAVLVLMYAR